MMPQPVIQIRVPASVAEDLKKAVKSVGHRESVAFALVTHFRTRRNTVILVRKIVSLEDDAYVQTTRHGAKWRGGAMLPILNQALAGNFGIVLFHVHQPRGPVELSLDDRRSARELLPVFQNLVPGRPHGSVVFSQDHVAGVIAVPDSDAIQEGLSLRWLGKVIVDLPSGTVPQIDETHPETYHRQILLLGSKGQSRLKGATVLVAGLSGGGSHAVQQLAYAGVGRIIGVDDDRASESNRHRLIGIEWFDVLFRRLKTKIAKRVVRRINRNIVFEEIPYAFPHQRAIDALKEADVVIGCVDTVHARDDLQKLASRFLVHYVDVGLLIVPAADGRSQLAIGGNVGTFIPGGPCAWCTGLVSQEKLDRETGARPRSYLQGADAQAQVVSFNGVLASQAVTEVLQLLTGFAPIEVDYSIKKYNGVEGTFMNWVVKRSPSCPVCGQMLGAGDLIWRKC